MSVTPRVDHLAVLCVLLAAALEAWLGRYQMNADGLAFLDHARDAAVHGPGVLVSDYWSPVYPGLIAILLAILKPSAPWAFPVVHLATFLTFLWALWCFLRLVGALADGAGSDPTWRLFALALFFWGECMITQISKAEPDYLMSGAFFLACACVLRAAAAPRSWLPWLLLGGALGCGYLSKFAMLPLAVALLIGLAAGWRMHPFSRVLAAAVCFAVFALPWGYLLSTRLDGGITFGRSGALNLNRPGSTSAFSFTAVVPMSERFEIVHHRPTVISYARMASGTYPLWYEPAYWTRQPAPVSAAAAPPASSQGVAVQRQAQPAQPLQPVHWARRISRVLYTSGQLRGLLRDTPVLLASVLALLVLIGGVGRANVLRWLADKYCLWGWPLVGLAGYIITWVEGRYVGPLLVVGFLAIFSAIVSVASATFMPTVRVILGVAGLTLVVPRLFDVPGQAATAIQQLRRSDWHADHTHLAASRMIAQAIPLPNGAGVGVLGSPFTAFFLSPGGLRVRLELPRRSVEEYCALDPAGRRAIRDLMRSHGAPVIIAERWIPCLAEGGWREIPGTDFRLLVQEP